MYGSFCLRQPLKQAFHLNRHQVRRRSHEYTDIAVKDSFIMGPERAGFFQCQIGHNSMERLQILYGVRVKLSEHIIGFVRIFHFLDFPLRTDDIFPRNDTSDIIQCQRICFDGQGRMDRPYSVVSAQVWFGIHSLIAGYPADRLCNLRNQLYHAVRNRIWRCITVTHILPFPFSHCLQTAYQSGFPSITIIKNRRGGFNNMYVILCLFLCPFRCIHKGILRQYKNAGILKPATIKVLQYCT